MEIRKAHRSNVKMRIGFSGPAGSGKTYSSLLLADGLCGLEKTVVIDTEADRASFYSHLGDYSILNLTAPFTSTAFSEAMTFCAQSGFDCIIIDSITAFWNGEGGVQEKVDSFSRGKQNPLLAWAMVTPDLQHISAMIQFSPAHVICNLRSKTEYAIETVGGKTTVKKLGLKPDYKSGFEYELTVFFELNNKIADVSKDCTGLFNEPLTITDETGLSLLKWSLLGIEKEKIKPPITHATEYFASIQEDFYCLIYLQVNEKIRIFFQEEKNWPISREHLERMYSKAVMNAGAIKESIKESITVEVENKNIE